MDAMDLLARETQIPQSTPAKPALLKRLTSALSEALTPRDVAAVVVQQGFEALGATRGFVGLLAEDGSVLDMIGMAGYAGESAGAWRRIPMGLRVPITDAVRMATAIFLGSAAQAADRYPDLRFIDGVADHALAAVPLGVSGRAFGALGMVFDRARAFDVEECTDILMVARQCAMALDRARLYEAAARAEAEAAVRIKEELLTLVSLRLRTPLTAILGWSSMLRSEIHDPRVARGVAIIERNSKMLARLADDLLEMDGPGPDDPGLPAAANDR